MLCFIITLLIGISAHSEAAGSEENLIKSLEIKHNKVTIKIHEGFKKKYLVDDFFAEYDEDINLEELPTTIVTLPFVLIIFSTVWASGETFYIDELDAKVHRGLQKLKKMYELMYPKTSWKGELIPRKLVRTPHAPKNHDKNTHTALLFSGGLDSTVSSLYHLDKKQLLITAWGQWDFPLSKPETWNLAKTRFIEFAQTYNFENSFIRSNYAEFFNNDVLEEISPEIPRWRIYTIEDVGWAGLTAPILYAKGYRRLRIASSSTWNYGYPEAMNPLIDGTMKFAGIKVIHDLYDYSRLDKAEFLANFFKKNPEKKPYLTICQLGYEHNCANCSKCLATVTALFAVGDTPADYGFPISLDELTPRLQKHLTLPLTSLTKLERYVHIQEKILRERSKDDEIAQAMSWLVEQDFRSSFPHTFEALHQQPLCWDKLSNLCPEIPVPDYCKNPHRKHVLAPKDALTEISVAAA